MPMITLIRLVVTLVKCSPDLPARTLLSLGEEHNIFV